MITVLNDTTIAVTIPPEGNINNSYLWGSYNQYWVRYTDMPKPGKIRANEIKLPPGQWEILGRPLSITEDQWKGIVDSKLDGRELWQSYENTYTAFHNATESGMSWIKSKSLDPLNIIILKKKSK